MGLGIRCDTELKLSNDFVPTTWAPNGMDGSGVSLEGASEDVEAGKPTEGADSGRDEPEAIDSAMFSARALVWSFSQRVSPSTEAPSSRRSFIV